MVTPCPVLYYVCVGKAVSMHRMPCIVLGGTIGSVLTIVLPVLACVRGWVLGAGCGVSRGDCPLLADTELANIGGLGCCPLLPLLRRAPPAPGQPQHPSLSQHTAEL